jgi:hypothetical protein
LAIDDKPEIRTKPVKLELYSDDYGTPKARINNASG